MLGPNRDSEITISYRVGIHQRGDEEDEGRRPTRTDRRGLLPTGPGCMLGKRISSPCFSSSSVAILPLVTIVLNAHGCGVH